MRGTCLPISIPSLTSRQIDGPKPIDERVEGWECEKGFDGREWSSSLRPGPTFTTDGVQSRGTVVGDGIRRD